MPFTLLEGHSQLVNISSLLSVTEAVLSRLPGSSGEKNDWYLAVYTPMHVRKRCICFVKMCCLQLAERLLAGASGKPRKLFQFRHVVTPGELSADQRSWQWKGGGSCSAARVRSPGTSAGSTRPCDVVLQVVVAAASCPPRRTCPQLPAAQPLLESLRLCMRVVTC